MYGRLRYFVFAISAAVVIGFSLDRAGIVLTELDQVALSLLIVFGSHLLFRR